jgi:hypothetical protein
MARKTFLHLATIPLADYADYNPNASGVEPSQTFAAQVTHYELMRCRDGRIGRGHLAAIATRQAARAHGRRG